MATIGNNRDDEIARVRNEFFTEERKETFKKLLEDEHEAEIHHVLKLKDGPVLFEKAKKLMQDIEEGRVKEEEKERTMKIIMHCLGAIKDDELVTEKYKEMYINSDVEEQCM